MAMSADIRNFRKSEPRSIACPFIKIGCTNVDVEGTEELQQHLNKEFVKHNILLLDNIVCNKNTISTMREDVEERRIKINEMQMTTDNLTNQNKNSLKKICEHAIKIEEYKNKIEETYQNELVIREELREIKNEFSNKISENAMKIEGLENKFEEFKQNELQMMKAELSTEFDGKLQNLRSEYEAKFFEMLTKSNRLTEENSNLKIQLEFTNEKLNDKMNQFEDNLKIENLKHHVNFLWSNRKEDNFKELYEKALVVNEILFTNNNFELIILNFNQLIDILVTPLFKYMEDNEMKTNAVYLKYLKLILSISCDLSFKSNKYITDFINHSEYPISFLMNYLKLVEISGTSFSTEEQILQLILLIICNISMENGLNEKLKKDYRKCLIKYLEGETVNVEIKIQIAISISLINVSSNYDIFLSDAMKYLNNIDINLVNIEPFTIIQIDNATKKVEQQYKSEIKKERDLEAKLVLQNNRIKSLHDYDEKHDLLPALIEFECPSCLELIVPKDAVMLRCGCNHCKSCLFESHREIEYIHELNCFFCGTELAKVEIIALIGTAKIQEMYFRIMKQSLFQCKSPKCDYVCYTDKESGLIVCSYCNKVNCLVCQDIHENMTCAQFKQTERYKDAQMEIEKKKKKKYKCVKCYQCKILLFHCHGYPAIPCLNCGAYTCLFMGIKAGPEEGCKCSPQRPCHKDCTYGCIPA